LTDETVLADPSDISPISIVDEMKSSYLDYAMSVIVARALPAILRPVHRIAVANENVGPRAEMPRYVGCYPTEIRKRVLSVKPGLLDLSTIEFRDERKILEGLEGDALETAYVEQVLPMRLDYAQRYLDQRSGLTDLRIMLGAVLLPLRALRRQ
jgi:hypothetical protein